MQCDLYGECLEKLVFRRRQQDHVVVAVVSDSSIHGNGVPWMCEDGDN